MGAVPVIDVAPLVTGAGDAGAVAGAIDDACRRAGFFSIVGHGVDATLQTRLDALSREFFALPESEKAAIGMARGGRAWRGWFAVGEELTSGVPDLKEGIYFGAELESSHARVAAGIPLHGPNLFPARPAALRDVVLAYMDELTRVGQAVLTGVAIGLGRDPSWFVDHLTADPLTLFRVFRYPPAEAADAWGVGEHTDYGLLTLLGQDVNGGLQVRTPDGWIEVDPIPGAFVCNIGDMLERISGGRYRSTPHRVRNASGAERLSFPFFLDPSWDAVIEGVPGTYGDYILAKVANVFPDLAASTRDGPRP
jgi:isopenicillin N synthase-like dioxygenase